MKIQFAAHWNHLLERFPADQTDIYFREEYVRLYETDAEKAVCCTVEEDDKCMLFPYLLRTFSFGEQELHDFETAYGYGGPLWNNEDDRFKADALRLMAEEMERQHYVAGFVRFHPLLQNQEGFECIGRLLAERRTVAIDLDQTEEEIWNNELHSKNRNVIRKAEKAGCRFVVDDRFEHLGDFVRLYDATMDKLAADGFYYFTDRYYRQFIEGMAGSFLGCVVDSDNTVISAAIFMQYGPYGHYHLSGSDMSRLSLSPNNFMLWEAAKELRRRGVKRFHLGGGTNSDEENSLFLFKRRFSKSTCQFYIGKLILNPEMYGAVCRDWEQRNPEKTEKYKQFLLKYKY